MVLEATMIVIDNSEYMRNGDYTPTRYEAQIDALNLIFSAKTQSNPENSVGLMSMGGKGPQVLATFTTDFGKILSGIHETKLGGNIHFATAIQVACLALKHRINKVQRQRIIIFTGSPITDDQKKLIKLGKKMKKDNVAIDIVNFGEEAENTEKLEKFIESLNNADNSHLVTIPPGPHLLSDRLVSSSILSNNEGVSNNVSSTNDFEFGVDPTLEPDLALALRMSLEEERARQERARIESEQANRQAESNSNESSEKAQPAKESTSESTEDSKVASTKDSEMKNNDLSPTSKKDDEKKDDDKMDIA